MSSSPETIDYEEIRGLLPKEAQKYLDQINDARFRTFALNKFVRLLYTNEELRQHYNQLKRLGYTVKQARRLRYLAPARLHRILNEEIQVVFGKDTDGKSTDRYSHTINLKNNHTLRNFHNIDKGYIK